MNTGTRIIQKTTALLIIMIMMIAHFALVGEISVSNAVDAFVTNNNNVEIKSYFIDGAGVQVANIDSTIYNKDLKLITEVTVKNEQGRGGYFKGTLSLSNANFKFKEGDSEEVYVSAGETKTIEKEIEFADTNDLTSTYLNQETNVVLNGEYVNSKKSYIIEGSVPVTINWKSVDTAESQFKANILTNSIYKINEENKHIIQLLLTSKLKDNSYPVKNTQIGLNVPNGAEKVSVHKRYTNATNGNKEFNENNYQYDQESGKLVINIDNNEQDGKITWNRNSKDALVVTMEFPENLNINQNVFSINDKITLYDDKELNVEQTLEIGEYVEGLITGNIYENEISIYKGKIYTGEDRNYTSTTSVYVDYVEAIEGIEVTENKSNFLDGDEEKDANIQIVKTIINKDEFDKIFGVDGNISIEDQNGNIVANITNASEVNENGDIVVSYGSDVTNIKITTSKPQTVGILNIVNEKKIAKTEYSREDINGLTGIKNTSEIKYVKNDKSEVNTSLNNTITLKQTSSKANINVEGTNSLSTTGENQALDLKVTLETNDESKDLYKNPTIKIVFPEQIKKLSTKYRLLYAGGLEKDSAEMSEEDGKNVMTIKLNGEQTSYSGDAISGTVLEVYAEIEEMDKLAVNSVEDIVLNYTNENAVEEIKDESVKINIVSESSVIVTNNEENFNTKTIGSNEDKAIELAVNEGEKTDKINMQLINNEGAQISNIAIVGQIPVESKSIDRISEINVNKEAKVYYTSVQNPSTDLNDSNNNWSENSDGSETYYLVSVESLENGEELDWNYNLKMNSNLDYNIQGIATYTASYTNTLTSMASEVESSDLLFTTANSEKISAKLTAQVGNDVLKDGDEVKAGEIINYIVELKNTSSEDLDNISLIATVPEGTTLLELKDPEQANEINIDGSQGIEINNFYGETDKDKVEYNNLSIKQGESTIYKYMVKVNNNIEDNKLTTAEISVDYGDDVVKSTTNHTLRQSPISIELIPLNTHNKLEPGYYYYYELKIVNNTNEEQKDINIDLNTNNLLSVNEILEKYSENQEKLKGSTVCVESLQPNEQKRFQVEVMANQPTKDLKVAEISAIAKDSLNNQYRSMLLQENVEGVKIDASIESYVSSGETTGYVNSGDKITYLIKLKNSGEKNANNLKISNQISDYLELESIKLNGEDVNYTKQIQSDEKYSIVEIESSLEAGKDLELEIIAIVDEELEPTEMLTISHNATIYNNIMVAQTEEVDYMIKAVNQNQEDNNNDDNSNNGNGANRNTYAVSGIVWIDADSNGAKDNTETLLQGIKVYAVNSDNNEIVKDNNGNVIESITNSEGLYNLDLPKGEYLIIFEYDTQKYIVTKYEAEKVSNDKSSKAIKSTTKINGELKEVAATDKITLTNSIANINLGLIEAKNFKLDVNKYISRIVVSNSKGTKTYDQVDETTLAKVEIGSKVLSGSNIALEYTIQVTNNGEASGYAKDIVDIIPADLKFSSTLNSDWYQTDEEIHNVSLANTIINPGETKEVKLILTKTMTSSNTGLVNNRAKIGKCSSVAGVEFNNNDEEATADVILGIKTGGTVTFILLTITTIAIIGGIAYLINKFIINNRFKL